MLDFDEITAARRALDSTGRIKLARLEGRRFHMIPIESGKDDAYASAYNKLAEMHGAEPA